MSLQLRAVEVAVKNLAAVGASYSVTFAGQVFSNVRPERRRWRRPPGQPHNFYVSHFAPFLKAVEPDEFVRVPVADGMDARRLQAAICAWCSKHWGTGGAFSTEVDPRDPGFVNVLRCRAPAASMQATIEEAAR